jgi:hypothetical protein
MLRSATWRVLKHGPWVSFNAVWYNQSIADWRQPNHLGGIKQSMPRL